MKKMLLILMLLTCISCDKGYMGLGGFFLSGGCDGNGSGSSNDCCDLKGTQWRWEGTAYGVTQAWTIKFTTDNDFEDWWGTPGNYFQNKASFGTWSCSNSKVSLYKPDGSFGNSSNITDNYFILDGNKYVKLN